MITRRKMLGGMAAVSATGGVAAAAAVEAESQADRVQRLAYELASELDGYLNGRFLAVVRPSRSGEDTVSLVSLVAWERQNGISPELQRLIQHHRTAHAEWTAVLQAEIHESDDRYTRADDAEGRALDALLDFHAPTIHDARGWARYLVSCGSIQTEVEDAFLGWALKSLAG